MSSSPSADAPSSPSISSQSSSDVDPALMDHLDAFSSSHADDTSAIAAHIKAEPLILYRSSWDDTTDVVEPKLDEAKENNNNNGNHIDVASKIDVAHIKYEDGVGAPTDAAITSSSSSSYMIESIASTLCAGDVVASTYDATDAHPHKIEPKIESNVDDRVPAPMPALSSTDSTSCASDAAAPARKRSRWSAAVPIDEIQAAAAAAAAATDGTESSSAAIDPSSSSIAPSADLGADGLPRKRSRWSAPAPIAADAMTLYQPNPPPSHSMPAVSSEQIEAFKIQLRIDQITRNLLHPSAGLADKEAEYARTGRDRSPSPEPLYDERGQRSNTRAARFVKSLEAERQQLIEALQIANPTYRAPAGFRRTRHERRLHIPIKEFPDYNFIGMIIGPRGHTQKRMEKESGCKIVIRGKGSQKEGRVPMRPQPGDDDELHVLVSGDNEAIVIATTKEVAKLLIPIDEQQNEHKARQLRELAVINGTLRDELLCRLCGLAGHRQVACPQRNQSWQPANIRCNICNSELHPAADCPQRHTRTAEQAAREMNDEYASFMDEFGGEGTAATKTTNERTLYITDGSIPGVAGQGDYAPPSSSSHRDVPPPPNSSPPSVSGYVHPDRLAASASPSHFYRDGGSRTVKSATDPRDAFREYRPANAAAIASSAALPSVSARDGFREQPQAARQGGGYEGGGHQPFGAEPQQHGYGINQHHHQYHQQSNGPHQQRYDNYQHHPPQQQNPYPPQPHHHQQQHQHPNHQQSHHPQHPPHQQQAPWNSNASRPPAPWSNHQQHHPQQHPQQQHPQHHQPPHHQQQPQHHPQQPHNGWQQHDLQHQPPGM